MESDKANSTERSLQMKNIVTKHENIRRKIGHTLSAERFYPQKNIIETQDVEYCVLVDNFIKMLERCNWRCLALRQNFLEESGVDEQKVSLDMYYVRTLIKEILEQHKNIRAHARKSAKCVEANIEERYREVGKKLDNIQLADGEIKASKTFVGNSSTIRSNTRAMLFEKSSHYFPRPSPFSHIGSS